MKSKLQNLIFSTVLLAPAVVCAQSQHGTRAANETSPPGATFVLQPPVAASAERLYFIGNGQIACLDGQSGRAIWLEKGPGLSTQAIPGAGPVITGAALVYMAGGGFFTAYGLDPRTGRKNWTLGKKSIGLAAGPNTVYLSTQYGLGVIAVNAKSGKVEWEKYANRDGGSLTKIVYAQGLLYTDSRNVWSARNGQIVRRLSIDPDSLATNGDQIFMSGDGLPVIAMVPGTGKTLWKAKNPMPPSRERTSYVHLAASSHYVVAAFYDDAPFDAHNEIVEVYDAKSGQLLWSKKVESKSGLWPDSVSVDNQLVYLTEPTGKALGEGKLTAFRGETGTQLWSRIIRDGILGAVLPAAGTVFLSTGGEYGSGQNDTLYALNNKTGEVRWKFTFKLPSTLPAYDLSNPMPRPYAPREVQK